MKTNYKDCDVAQQVVKNADHEELLVLENLNIDPIDLKNGKHYMFTIQDDISEHEDELGFLQLPTSNKHDVLEIAAFDTNVGVIFYVASNEYGMWSDINGPSHLRYLPEYQNGNIKRQIQELKERE